MSSQDPITDSYERLERARAAGWPEAFVVERQKLLSGS